MKQRTFLTITLFLAALTLSAQNYSPCYKEKYQQGVALYYKGDYNGAKAKFVAAKGCPIPNTKEADTWIGKCNAEINKQAEEDRIAEEKSKEAKRKADAEATEAKRKAEEAATEAKRKAEEEKRKKEEEAKKKPQFTVNEVSFTMIFVQGGTFQMGGDNDRNNAKPIHTVSLSDFYIGETEVTQALWNAVMGRDSEAPKWTDEKGRGDIYPAYAVSWNSCRRFCDILNEKLSNQLPSGYVFALPTEAQWEYSARGGDKSHGYIYSGSDVIDDVAWYEKNSEHKTHPVKSKKMNELSLYDMSGNVQEWCEDRYGYYSNTAQTDPKGPASGSEYVLRGGGYGTYGIFCGVSDRGQFPPHFQWPDFGLRLALVQKQEVKHKDPEEQWAIAKSKGVVAITVNETTFNMVFVKGGTFKMGSKKGDEMPVHEVTLSDFCIGETEVTAGLWNAVMGSIPPESFRGNDMPVGNVSWIDIQFFIKKLNNLTGMTFRLPTEAQWEYSARGGSKSRHYKYSGSNNINSVAWYWGNSKKSKKPRPVKTKKANELGLYDMSGNLCEWCQDWYGNYSSSAQTDPEGPSSGSYRVIRGGWWGRSAEISRVVCRDKGNPLYSHSNTSFRLVLVHQ